MLVAGQVMNSCKVKDIGQATLDNAKSDQSRVWPALRHRTTPSLGQWNLGIGRVSKPAQMSTSSVLSHVSLLSLYFCSCLIEIVLSNRTGSGSPLVSSEKEMHWSTSVNSIIISIFSTIRIHISIIITGRQIRAGLRWPSGTWRDVTSVTGQQAHKHRSTKLHTGRVIKRENGCEDACRLGTGKIQRKRPKHGWGGLGGGACQLFNQRPPSL